MPLHSITVAGSQPACCHVALPQSAMCTVTLHGVLRPNLALQRPPVLTWKALLLESEPVLLASCAQAVQSCIWNYHGHGSCNQAPMACCSLLELTLLWLTAGFAWQEYLPRIKDNDVLRAVEKNSSGSRPKELFEEVLEEVDKQWEADR